MVDEKEGALAIASCFLRHSGNCCWRGTWSLAQRKAFSSFTVSVPETLQAMLSTDENRPTIGEPPLQDIILKDTSLAATVDRDENRRVFFQDNAGRIREAVMPVSGSRWEAGPGHIIASDARNYTPISVFEMTGKTGHPVSLIQKLASEYQELILMSLRFVYSTLLEITPWRFKAFKLEPGRSARPDRQCRFLPAPILVYTNTQLLLDLEHYRPPICWIIPPNRYTSCISLQIEASKLCSLLLIHPTIATPGGT